MFILTNRKEVFAVDKKMCEKCGRFPAAFFNAVVDGKPGFYGFCCLDNNGDRLYAALCTNIETGEEMTVIEHGYDMMGANFGMTAVLYEMQGIDPDFKQRMNTELSGWKWERLYDITLEMVG
jgi:hypothetical protein